MPNANPSQLELITERLDRALSAHRSGRLKDAVGGYRQVLQLDPLQPQALHLLGVCLAQLQRFDEARVALEKAIAICPKDATIWTHYGNVLWGLKRGAEALEALNLAISLEPRSADAHYNRGVVLNDAGCPDLALESFDRVIALAPHRADAHNNRGSSLAALGRDQEALESYGRALAINPSLSEGRWNKSLVLLRQGNLREGWELHTACPEYQSPNGVKRFPSRPPWSGSGSLQGKRLFLYADQGYGDVIQYCRYAPTLQRRGATVIAEAPDALRSVMQSLEGVDVLTAAGDATPPFDLHCPFSNLPGALRTTLDSIPATVPYLRADHARKDHWARRLGKPGLLRVGLVWSGNPGHRQDASRCIPLAALARLKNTGVEFVSLQKDVRESDTASVSLVCRHALGAELRDFSDTAALISHLDLVISVDTAVAHLAGALGGPLWVLLPFVPDWRWLIDRDDSPWYPSARLFRQSVRGRWDEPITAVQEALRIFARERSR